MQVEWEYFRDLAYYDLWAVRPKGEAQWGTMTFHLVNEDEAKGLAQLLGALPKEVYA